MTTIGLIAGAALLIVCAWAGQKNALYIPALLLAVAAVANAIAG